MRMFVHPCFEFAHCHLGEIKTRANKSHSTDSIYVILDNVYNCYHLEPCMHAYFFFMTNWSTICTCMYEAFVKTKLQYFWGNEIHAIKDEYVMYDDQW